MNSHKDLLVYQKSLDLVEMIYKETGKFPTEEKFGIISQLRRSAISLPSNIAEGAGRKGKKEFIQFYILHLVHLMKLKPKWKLRKDSNILKILQHLQNCSYILNECF